MDDILRHLVTVKRAFVALTEAGYALVAFIILIYLLLGADAGPYVVSVITNLTLLIQAFGTQTLVAVAIVFAAISLTRRNS